MIEHKPIKVGYDLDIFERYSLCMDINVNLSQKIHWIICGKSGSGKSYFELMFIRNVLVEYQDDVVLYFLNFKRDRTFESAFYGYEHYYSDTDCEEGLKTFYEDEYLKVRNGEITDGRLRLIVFDEVAAFIIWISQRDKKQAEHYRALLLEVLLTGRSLIGGACGLIACMQRIDTKFIEGREQFFVTICFGKMSRELKLMVMQGEELEQKEVYSVGEGIIRTDDIGTRFLKVPKLRSITKVEQQIRDCLHLTDTAGGGGGEM